MTPQIRTSIFGALLALTFSSVPVLAHDAGREQCRHNECTGGLVSDQIPDTRPKFADSQLPNPGRVADCPAGFTNNGLTCGRGAQSISAPSQVPSCPPGFANVGLFCGGNTLATAFQTRGPSSMTCPAGFFLNTTTVRCHRNCPAGFTNTGETCFSGVSTLGPDAMSCHADEVKSGVRCFPAAGVCPPDRELSGPLCLTKCPAGSTRSAISTCVHDVAWRANTHLWVVNRALDLLASQTADPVAMKAASVMRSQACRGTFDSTTNNNPAVKGWEDGLWDTDDGDLADSPTSAGLPTDAQGTHFYNGAGRDAFGNPTSLVTYKYLGIERNVRGNARTNADALIRQATSLGLDSPSTEACYAIGRALHYMTDITQPMHATSFSGGDAPLLLHPIVEEYIADIQARFPATTWDRRFAGMAPNLAFHEASLRSAALAPGLMRALAGDGGVCTIKAADVAIPYTGFCFVQDPAVDTQLGQVLTDGYQSTASYILSVFAQPTAPPATATRCADEGSTCTIPAGTAATVWFGANGVFFSKTGVLNSVACSNDVFGDPTPGVVKACSFVAQPLAVPPANAVQCAVEGDTCAIPSGRTAIVWFGANGSFHAKTGVVNSIACTNGVFGDPIFGVVKACSFLTQ